MGKRLEQKETKSKRSEPKEEEDNSQKPVPLDDDADNQGFSVWLRSNEGIDMMRLFFVTNSLLIFLTMAWPSIQEVYAIVQEYFYGEEELDE